MINLIISRCSTHGLLLCFTLLHISNGSVSTSLVGHVLYSADLMSTTCIPYSYLMVYIVDTLLYFLCFTNYIIPFLPQLLHYPQVFTWVLQPELLLKIVTESLMYPFPSCFFINSHTFSFSCLDIKYVLPFFGTKSSFRLITWSHGFLVSILFDFAFSNTFSHLWNFCSTISLTFSLSSSISSLNFSSIVHSHSSLSAFSAFLFFFSIFFFCSMSSFTTKFLLQRGRYLVIFTSPISQFISGLCTCNQGISSITSVFSKLHISILILSTWFL